MKKTLLPAPRARDLLARMKRGRVVVVGDVMLDAFVFGRVARISPEAPVPVVEVTGESERPGGAANVAMNVNALGGAATLVGVVGDDGPGQRISEELIRAKIESKLVVAVSRPTTVKTRIVAHHQQLMRTDREVTTPVDGVALARAVLSVHEALRPGCVLIISDYDKGVVTEPLARSVITEAQRLSIPVLVDPKVRNISLFAGATLVTPNRTEAEQISGLKIVTDSDAEAAIRRITDTAGSAGVLITRGEHGMSLGLRPMGSNGKHAGPLEFAHVHATAHEVYDVTGAGDTAIATLGLALVAGASASEAMALANFAAGIAVGKLGTATVAPAEIPAAMMNDSVATAPPRTRQFTGPLPRPATRPPTNPGRRRS